MATRLDYKFQQVLRNGVETIATVAFYTGEDVRETDDLTGKTVTVYRRTAKVEDRVLTFRGDVSDDELRLVLNERLAALRTAEYPARDVLAEQRVVRASTVKPIERVR